VVQGFNIVTGTRNRACVKLLGGPRLDKHVKTYARDTVSAKENRTKDQTEGEQHKVSANSAFLTLAGGKNRFYLSHDITERPEHYLNSRKDVLGEKELWYKSVIVFPIRLAVDTPQIEGEARIERDTELGFLAVDCARRNVYDERYDVMICNIIADALFAVLYRWRTAEALDLRAAHAPMASPGGRANERLSLDVC
jgi:hypothetical protein